VYDWITGHRSLYTYVHRGKDEIIIDWEAGNFKIDGERPALKQASKKGMNIC
jgi:hypothetical protein